VKYSGLLTSTEVAKFESLVRVRLRVRGGVNSLLGEDIGEGLTSGYISSIRRFCKADNASSSRPTREVTRDGPRLLRPGEDIASDKAEVDIIDRLSTEALSLASCKIVKNRQ